MQNRKKGVVQGEERLDGKAAKRFLALPPHSLLFLTPLTFARDCLFCLHFWMKVFFLILTLSFSNISGSILRGNGRVMKICKYVLPSGICALLQRLWRDEPIQIASEEIAKPKAGSKLLSPSLRPNTVLLFCNQFWNFSGRFSS